MCSQQSLADGFEGVIFPEDVQTWQGTLVFPLSLSLLLGVPRPWFWSLLSLFFASPVLQSHSTYPIPGLFPYPRIYPGDEVQATGASVLQAAGLGLGFKAVFAMLIESQNILDWKGIFKGHLFQPPCSDQRHL